MPVPQSLNEVIDDLVASKTLNVPVPGAGGQYPVNMPTSSTAFREVE
jgi:hypothetical protein